MVEVFGNRGGQESVFELLWGPQASPGSSFIANDDIRSICAEVPELSKLARWDTGKTTDCLKYRWSNVTAFYSNVSVDASLVGSILLHSGELQHLSWLGLQWTLLGQRPPMRDWLQQLFPRLTLETSKLDTNTPESICLLDLEVNCFHENLFADP